MDEVLAAVRDARAGPRPLALYVHIPFCASKCHFCDWVVDIPVRQLRQQAAERKPYIEAIKRQIAHYGPMLMEAGYSPQLLYWGGGTPGRLMPQEMQAIHAALASSLDLSGIVEWTMETTPNDVTAEKLVTMKEMGVTRISVGVQSFDPHQLRTAGRAHTPEVAHKALHMLREHGFDNFNIDVIVGFPGEDLQRTLATVQTTISFEPRHISSYPFRATANTVMTMQVQRKRVEKPTLEGMIEADETSRSVLLDAGYHEYSHGYWVKDSCYEDRDANYTYGMTGERIGFGSGADSVMCARFLRNHKTNYAGFLGAPLQFDQVQPFSLANPGMFVNHIGGALMTRTGLNFERLQRLTGVSFEALRATPQISAWLDYLRAQGAEFIETDTDLQIADRNRHRVYIAQLLGIVG